MIDIHTLILISLRIVDALTLPRSAHDATRVLDTYPSATASSLCTAYQGSSLTNPQALILTLGNSSNDDFGDPRSMLDPVSGLYYAYADNNFKTNQTNVPYAVSADFRSGWTWYNYHDTFPNPGGWEYLGDDGDMELGDPFVQYYPSANHYVMYYSAQTNLTNATDSSPHCIGIAVASSPVGPFIARPQPFICTNGTYLSTHISPEVTLFNGTYYIASKYSAGFATGTSSEIWLAELDDTGTVITTPQQTIYTSPPATTTDIANNDAEGPNILVGPNGVFYLFFVSGYAGSSDYAIRYIPSSGGIYGPYDANPIIFLSTGYTNNVYLLSPGGPTFVEGDLMMFMTTVPNTRNCTNGGEGIRGPRVAKLQFNSNNTISLPPNWFGL